MKRSLLTLVLSGLVGTLLVGNAEACHLKKCGCAPAPTCAVAQPAPCSTPAPAATCEPTCGPRRHLALFSCFKGLKLGLHRKAACAAPAAPCATVAYAAPTYYPTAPIYSSPQTSGQH
jgi:hypothetical protein